MSFNKVMLYGNLGRDVELRYTPQGTPVANFSMATSEKYKDKEETTWWKVAIFGKRAETASQYLTKGSAVFIEGTVRLEKWTDREGKEQTSLVVTASDMKFVGKGNGGGRDEYDQSRRGTDDHDQRPRQGQPRPALPLDENDVPF